ncbi:Os02g0647600 [Oryza sativa Japonica Group]|uniref:Os02g0647600 protein n=1 Tax=Oryza sativa subsp. japonica TaxID=39947 RepID=A0A0N7KFS5_ORYSJ|nr:Os02g0647600 [Oryza sativa Japonica Group]
MDACKRAVNGICDEPPQDERHAWSMVIVRRALLPGWVLHGHVDYVSGGPQPAVRLGFISHPPGASTHSGWRRRWRCAPRHAAYTLMFPATCTYARRRPARRRDAVVLRAGRRL